MNRFLMLSIGLACVICIGFADAAETSDPTGNWKWSVFSLKLKFADDKLTGTITLPNKDEIEIKDASFKDNQVIFSVTHGDPMTNMIMTTYRGRLDGGTIKGEASIDSSKRRTLKKRWEPNREKP